MRQHELSSRLSRYRLAFPIRAPGPASNMAHCLPARAADDAQSARATAGAVGQGASVRMLAGLPLARRALMRRRSSRRRRGRVPVSLGLRIHGHPGVLATSESEIVSTTLPQL
jgi:hypothetical protein